MATSSVFLLLASHLISCALAQDVISPAAQYYSELNCSVIQKHGGPTTYDCGILDNLKVDKCYYGGKQYSVGESVGRDVIKNRCVVECTCDQHLQQAHFTCVNIECPSLIHPTFEPGCYNVFEHGSCCPIGNHCDDKDPPAATCQYGGKTYKEGERFYPADQSCLTCICKQGFNGTLSEPWCEKTPCEMYLHYGNRIREGCIPTYYKPTDCCPIPIWRCPAETDVVVNPTSATPVKTKSKENICKFGKLELDVGESLSPSRSDKCVECSCLAPPHLSCLMNTTCYEGAF